MTLEGVMMFEQDDHHGLSNLERSFGYEIFQYWYHQNAAVSGSGTESPSPRPAAAYSSPGSGRDEGRRPRKRRRRKNEEEKENQRMSHIAVERNRRKQMNHLLSILRSIMPPSYSQRGEQASIVEGAINYVKELEQFLQSLEAQKAIKCKQSQSQSNCPNYSQSLFSSFFSFPQYSTATAAAAATSSSGGRHEQPTRAAVAADVEVTVVEKHANIRVLTKAQPRLLFKMVTELCSLGLTILHLNLTTSQHYCMNLFTLSVKVEEACPVTSADDIASAVHELVTRISV